MIKVDATEIIAKINRGEAVVYKNAIIEGRLDMTQLANVAIAGSVAYMLLLLSFPAKKH